MYYSLHIDNPWIYLIEKPYHEHGVALLHLELHEGRYIEGELYKLKGSDNQTLVFNELI